MQFFYLQTFSILELFVLVASMMLLSAIFSATEAAYISLDRVAIRRLERSKSLLSKLVVLLVRRFSLYIITSLTFNTLSNFIATFTAVKIFSYFWNWLLQRAEFLQGLEVFADIFFIIMFSALVLIFSDFFPKRIALRYPVAMAKFFAPMLFFLYVLLYPLSFLLSRLISSLLRVLKKQESEAGRSKNLRHSYKGPDDEHKLFLEPFSRSHFTSYVQVSSKTGILHEVEGELLEEFLKMQGAAIRSFIIPREQMKGINIDRLDFPDTAFITKLRRFRHENIPFYEGDKDNIVGALSQRNLVFDDSKQLQLKACQNAAELKALLDTPLTIPENKNVLLAIKDIHESNSAMALVIDEHGGTQGIVIYKDILYRIFGGLGDDDDDDEAKTKIEDIGRGYFQIDASISLSAVNDFFRIALEAKEAETLAGYLLEKFKRIPGRYDSIADDKLFYVIQNRSQRGIQKVMAHRLSLRKKGVKETAVKKEAGKS